MTNALFAVEFDSLDSIRSILLILKDISVSNDGRYVITASVTDPFNLYEIGKEGSLSVYGFAIVRLSFADCAKFASHRNSVRNYSGAYPETKGCLRSRFATLCM